MALRVASEAFTDITTVRADPHCACVTDTTPDDDTVQSYIDAASDMITIVTGYISGRQTVRARPCRRDDWCEPCSCCGLDAIPLGDLRPTVTQVKVSGVVISADYYWLHWNGVSWVLARKPESGQLTPQRWPSDRKRWAADTETDTFSITYTQGIHVDDVIIQDAVMEIICDLAAEPRRQSNRVEGARSMSGGGLTVELEEDRIERLRNGDMGPMTRRMMGVLRPHGNQTPAVWAPELMGGWDLNLELVP